MMVRTASGRSPRPVSAPQFQVFTNRQFGQIRELQCLTPEQRFDIEVVANVLPFRVNQYVLDELIDWSDPLNDPMFILSFPQPDMLAREDFEHMATLMRSGPASAEITATAREIRARLNPHPAGQMEMNVPELEDQKLGGMQHKYHETLLFFPSQGQVCHAYCTFCFRWAQFVGDQDLKFASNEMNLLYRHLATHREISDLSLTGGDPMVMKAKHLRTYLEPLLERKDVNHVQTVRIGTKALTYWPHRFVTDPDADDVLRLLESLIARGKHVAIMAHYNHWRELEPAMTRKAIKRMRAAGARIRGQGPLLAPINDAPEAWTRLWREQVRQGLTPYYMFVERDTGARRYFEVPLARAWEIYREAVKNVSGLARTVRGPSMSAGPGKVEIQGVAEVRGEKVFVLRFLQGRNEDWVQRPFFARFDASATWLDGLQPAFGEKEFFFDAEYCTMLETKALAA